MHTAIKTIGLLLFFAIPVKAQYVQGGSVNAAPDTIGGDWTAKASYAYTFPKPLTSPCTVMVSIRGPEQSVADFQGNSFTLATGNPGRSDRLFYSTTCGTGADTVTVSCPSACWSQFDVTEYAGVWVPDQLSPEVLNVTGVDGYTSLITPSQDGELIVVIGNNHTTNSPGIVGAGGFTVRANANQFIGDLLQAKAAPIYGEVTYATPVLWCQRTISFKRVDTPPAPTPHKATLTWTDTANPLGTTYNVYRSTGPSSCPAVSYTLLANIGALTYVDTTVVAQETYCYEVKAFDGTTESIEGVIQFVPGSVSTITVQ